MALPYQMFGKASPSPVTQAVAQATRMAHGDPSELFNQMMQTNPQFRTFVQDNRGKTPQQIARENGIDLGQVVRAMGGQDGNR